MRRPLTRHQIWFFLALLLVIGGMASALAAANSVARSDDQKARQSFDRSSADVTDSLRSALQHEADLVINAGGYLVAEPNSSEAQFLGWVGSVQLWQRYPEVQGLGRWSSCRRRSCPRSPPGWRPIRPLVLAAVTRSR